MEDLERRIFDMREELDHTRCQRQVDEAAFACVVQEELDKQADLEESLAARDCSTLLYIPHFMGDPASIAHKQAMLCSYVHNIEVNKMQMKLMTWQSSDQSNHYYKILQRFNEEAGEVEITLLNDMTRVQLATRDLKDRLDWAAMVIDKPRKSAMRRSSIETVQTRRSHTSILDEIDATLEMNEFCGDEMRLDSDDDDLSVSFDHGTPSGKIPQQRLFERATSFLWRQSNATIGIDDELDTIDASLNHEITLVA